MGLRAGRWAWSSWVASSCPNSLPCTLRRSSISISKSFRKGCSTGPNYQKPDVAVAPGWKEAQQSGVDTRSADLSRWWQSFNDPLLNSLAERTVQSNLDLRLAEDRIREARAARGGPAGGGW